MQRADNLGVSGSSCEIFKDFQLFAEDERIFSETAKTSLIQQKEQEPIIGEFQILWTLLSKPVAVILQVGLLETWRNSWHL